MRQRRQNSGERADRLAQHGEAISSNVNESLQSIVGAVELVTETVVEISRASDEQAAGIDQVNRAMNQVDKVTQSSAATAEKSSSVARASV